jgi:hypothetical protein
MEKKEEKEKKEEEDEKEEKGHPSPALRSSLSQVRPPFPITLIITPPYGPHSLLHPRGLIPRQAHTRRPQNIRAKFQQPIVPAASMLVADCCVLIMLFYRRLISGGMALFLSSSPVVAALSLPCSPPPPSPPLLADHDLDQCLTGPALLQPQPLSQLDEYLRLYFFGTRGAPAGQGFNPWP